ncbi:acetyltransferase [Vibrio cholerae]|nr:acetyltransferase [Vibrio cholerae]
MVMVVMFEFSVMRCQPLRRALCTIPIDFVC